MLSPKFQDNNQQDALNAFLAFKAFKAAIVNPAIRYTVWRYVTEGLKAKSQSMPKLPRPQQ